MKKAIPAAAKRYQEQLNEEIDADREAHGKKPLKRDNSDADSGNPSGKQKEKTIIESTTDQTRDTRRRGSASKSLTVEGFRRYRTNGP